MSRSKVKVAGNENVKSFFAHIFVEVDRFTSNQDKNDQRPILHISSNIFHHRQCFVFMLSCNYPGGPDVAAVT